MVPGLPAGVVSGRLPIPKTFPIHPPSLSSAAVEHGEGLLHDARNLMGALGLYCDLLSMPGVLKPEHHHYAEEVRMLGTRSAAMIQQLMEWRFQAVVAESDCPCLVPSAKPEVADLPGSAGGWLGGTGSGAQSGSEVHLVSLRMIVERCSGLLRRVACGRAIEIHYGAAAPVAVQVPEEAVERILVNLVRNAAAALGRLVPASDATSDAAGNIAEGEGMVREANGSATGGVIRIEVGMLVNRVGDLRPWPFRRVRLVVEDTGCGMTPDQLDRLLCGHRAPSRGSHGIGFHVVQELVGASGGELRVMSSPGAGTRVQIEWGIAGATPPEETTERDDESSDHAEGRQSC
jgi:signal transduction histidine kinase